MGYGPLGGWNAGMPRPGCGSACGGGSVWCVRRWQCMVRAEVAVRGACGGGSAWAEVAVRACGPKYNVFPFCIGRAYRPPSM